MNYPEAEPSEYQYRIKFNHTTQSVGELNPIFSSAEAYAKED